MPKRVKKYIPIERKIAEEMIEYFRSKQADEKFDFSAMNLCVHLQMQCQDFDSEDFDELFSRFLVVARQRIERERNPTPKVEEEE